MEVLLIFMKVLIISSFRILETGFEIILTIEE